MKLHPSSFIRHPSRRGFTLVELLTVMTIIAVLVALLLPAVLIARSYARAAQCMNNQSQLALAIIAYEGAKTHFPGYANNIYVPGTTRRSNICGLAGRRSFCRSSAGRICGRDRRGTTAGGAHPDFGPRQRVRLPVRCDESPQHGFDIVVRSEHRPRPLPGHAVFGNRPNDSSRRLPQPVQRPDRFPAGRLGDSDLDVEHCRAVAAAAALGQSVPGRAQQPRLAGRQPRMDRRR